MGAHLYKPAPNGLVDTAEKKLTPPAGTVRGVVGEEVAYTVEFSFEPCVEITREGLVEVLQPAGHADIVLFRRLPGEWGVGVSGPAEREKRQRGEAAQGPFPQNEILKEEELFYHGKRADVADLLKQLSGRDRYPARANRGKRGGLRDLAYALDIEISPGKQSCEGIGDHHSLQVLQ